MSTTLARSRTRRAIYLGLGIFMLAIGIVGVWLPLIPTTGPVLPPLGASPVPRSGSTNGCSTTVLRADSSVTGAPALGFTVRPRSAAVIALTVTFGLSIWLPGQPPSRHRPGRAGAGSGGVHRQQADKAERRRGIERTCSRERLLPTLLLSRRSTCNPA